MKLIVALLLATWVLVGCGAGAPAKNVIKVGLNNLPNPPFSYTDADGKAIGYTVDYLKELEKKFPDFKFEYEAVDGNSQLIGTDTGKYTISANYWFRNPVREQKYIFADSAYGYSVTALVVKKGRTDIKNLDDLVGKKLVPMTPNSGLLYPLKDYNLKHPGKEVKIELIDQITTADGLKLVDSGQYDAFFVNVHNFVDTNAKLKLNLDIGGIISKEGVWVLFNKNQGELAKKFEAATTDLIKDGTLPKLAQKWFNVDFFNSLEYINQNYKYGK